MRQLRASLRPGRRMGAAGLPGPAGPPRRLLRLPAAVHPPGAPGAGRRARRSGRPGRAQGLRRTDHREMEADGDEGGNTDADGTGKTFLDMLAAKFYEGPSARGIPFPTAADGGCLYEPDPP